MDKKETVENMIKDHIKQIEQKLGGNYYEKQYGELYKAKSIALQALVDLIKEK